MGSLPCHRPARRGWTLLEMLIVLAVLVTILALVGPTVSKPLWKRELRDAARQIRIELAKARLAAIESATARQFRFQPGTGRFELARRSAEVLADGPLPGGFGGSADDGSRVPRSADPSQAAAIVQELPHGIVFWTERPGEQPLGDSDQVFATENTEWSAPIVFYPNGRTSNARLRLHGYPDYYVDVTLRGLTGTAKVGKIVRHQREKPL
jgi:prepilin-type N-terminal cleavage/methylation domain-containing protein